MDSKRCFDARSASAGRALVLPEELARGTTGPLARPVAWFERHRAVLRHYAIPGDKLASGTA
jgi:hypothetical protein